MIRFLLPSFVTSFSAVNLIGPLVVVKISTTMWAKNQRSFIKNQYFDSFSLYLSLELDPLMLQSIIKEHSSISNRNAMSQCSMQFEYFVLGMAFQIDLFHHKAHRISSIEKRKSALWCVSIVPVWNIIQTIPIDIEYHRVAGQKPRYALHRHTPYTIQMDSEFHQLWYWLEHSQNLMLEKFNTKHRIILCVCDSNA